MFWPANLVVIATGPGRQRNGRGRGGRGEVGRVTVVPVLLDGVVDVLVGEGVLKLGGGRRDAIDQEGHVQGLVGVRVVGQLAGDGDPVRAVKGREDSVRP